MAELIAVGPEHVSIYMLEVDEGSRLGKESLAGGTRYSAEELPTPDESSDFYEYATTELGRAGYEHYEISNWAEARVSFAAQFEILAAGALFGIWGGRAFV